MSCDGEAVVLQSSFMSEIRAKFDKEQIHLGKLPASCSSRHQASDVAPVFRSVKNQLSKMYENGEVVYNYVLDTNIRQTIQGFISESNVSLTAARITNISMGCMEIVNAVAAKATAANVKLGFEICGQYPLSFETVMSRTQSNVTAKELQDMKTHIIRDIDLFLEQGYLTEQQLEASEIPTNDDSNRDQAPIQNQRAVLITHPRVRDRHRERQNNGLDLGDLILDSDTRGQRQQFKEAATRIGNIEKATSRKEEAQKLKDSKTKAELNAEKELKKAQKRQRDEERAHNDARAKVLLYKK